MPNDDIPMSEKIKNLKEKLDKLEQDEKDRKEVKQLKQKIKEMENKKKPINKLIRGFKTIWRGDKDD